jgi:hypothetical protein
MPSNRHRELVEKLKMQAHPEGGHFVEMYRSPLQVAVPYATTTRAACTGIYSLIGTHDRSSLHRIKSDEMWHFYDGAPLTVVVLDAAAPRHHHRIVLGRDMAKGQVMQAVVPAGEWFGAYIDPATGPTTDTPDYALVGCTVAPGFDFADFELADTERLTRAFPHAADVIELLKPKINTH